MTTEDDTGPGREQAGPSLRERQAAAVRAELRRAFVALVARRGLNGFTLKEVAAAAGVSERTLYRHYAGRDELVQAVHEHDEAALERRITASAGELWTDPDLMARAFALFAEEADLVRASRLLRLEAPHLTPTARRTAEIRAAVEQHGVAPAAVEQVVALIRLLDGSDTWVRVEEGDLDLDARAAGDAVQWAMQVLIRAALRIDGPLRPERSDAP